MRRLAILTICSLAAAAAFAQAPPANAPTAPKKVVKTGPGPKTPAEQQAVQALLQAQMPDDVIKAADELVTKFPSTDFKAFALEREGEAYQQKNDNAKAIVYGEQALEADPMNFDADNLLANVLAATTRDTDLDKEEKLAKADKYSHDALTTLEGPKPWMYGDAQWPLVKAAAASQAYQALGNAALVRKKTDEAVADFQKGIDANPDHPDPILMIRVGRALLTAKKADEAIVWFDKAINAPNVPAQIKSIAQNDKARAQQSKGK
jgi:tetratricopeptide (TPR) repeat protein